MDAPLFLLAPIAFIGIIAILEHRNPLWRKYVDLGQPLPNLSDLAKSVQMVFFWEGPEAYGKSDQSDYWNAMDIYASDEGLAIKRPLILFGRRSVFIPWDQLAATKPFYAWLTKRRALKICGSELYFSVTDKFYKRHICQYIKSAS